MKGNESINRRTALFAFSQSTLLPVGVFAAIRARASKTARLQQLPELRTQPIQVKPTHDLPAVVSDDQLIQTLSRLRLPRTDSPAKVNHVDHALRMWGHKVVFEDDNVMDGAELLSILVDDHALRSNWGKDVRPLLLETPEGIRVRTQEGNATASHVDHTLATLTEIGVPLTKKIRTRSGEFQVKDVLNRALRTFSLNQPEYEWTALALGLYADGPISFSTTDGQVIDFDLLTKRLMRESLGHGVCYGGHRLFTLAMLMRIDSDEHRIFSDTTRLRVDSHLAAATQRLYRTQHREGFWDRAWPGYKVPSKQDLWTQGARLVATGHALEWWAMVADERLLPPRETIVRAGQWLVREIETLQDSSVKKNYTFLTHAGRALSLWRAELPADSWTRLAPTLSEQKRMPVSAPTSEPASLWQDERGFLLSIEFIFLATLTIIGLLVGFAVFRDAMVQELGDTAASVASLSQTFQYQGETEAGTFGNGVSAIDYDASVAGSSYADAADFGEAVLDASGQAPVCILIEASSVENEG